MQSLHLPTLTLALTAGFALLVVQYTVSGQRWLPRGELRRWALLCLLLFGATALLTLRGEVPGALVAATGALALGSGLLALVLALLRFLRRPLQPHRLALAFVAYCLIVTASVLLAEPALRVALVAFSAAAFLLPLAGSVSRHGWQAERSLRAVAVALWVLEAMLVLRGVHALLEPDAFALVETGGWAPLRIALPYTLGLLALLVVAFGYVLAAQERAHQRLKRLATRDTLTGLANRRTYESRLHRALAQLPRSADPLGLALLDVDDFKRINDQHGHAVGDQALRHLAQVLKPRLRRVDSLARWGGEEFALLLPATPAPGCALLMHSLRQALRDQPLRLRDGGSLTLSVSIGWLSLPGGQAAPSPAQLLSELDRAMYAVKQSGKDGAREAQLSRPPEHHEPDDEHQQSQPDDEQ